MRKETIYLINQAKVIISTHGTWVAALEAQARNKDRKLNTVTLSQPAKKGATVPAETHIDYLS